MKIDRQKLFHNIENSLNKIKDNLESSLQSLYNIQKRHAAFTHVHDFFEKINPSKFDAE